ncbi:MAG TPA: hypothetical protein VH440_08385 [Candidatus Limnocylindrales bacterium]|jgi:hypothetical protein
MYQWLVFVHLVGLVLFLLMHGVSMWTAFGVRRDPRPESARLLLGLSMRANQAMYLGLLLLAIGGLGAAWNANLLVAGWVVASYVVLVIVMVGMYAMGASFYYPLREAVMPKDGGPSTIDAGELARRVDNRRPEGLAIVGLGGLVILVWLMTLKPF